MTRLTNLEEDIVSGVSGLALDQAARRVIPYYLGMTYASFLRHVVVIGAVSYIVGYGVSYAIDRDEGTENYRYVMNQIAKGQWSQHDSIEHASRKVTVEVFRSFPEELAVAQGVYDQLAWWS